MSNVLSLRRNNSRRKRSGAEILRGWESTINGGRKTGHLRIKENQSIFYLAEYFYQTPRKKKKDRAPSTYLQVKSEDYQYQGNKRIRQRGGGEGGRGNKLFQPP